MSGILIIGKRSFIGNCFIKYSEYKDIRATSLLETEPASIDFTGIEIVIHLAAVVHVYNKIPPEEFYRVNRDLCVDVARYAKASGVKQFIFMSTAKVYGEFKRGSEPFTEESVCHPSDHYGKSKYQAEMELKKLDDNGFIVSIIRTPIVYGDEIKANMRQLIKLIYSFPLLPFAKIDNKRNYTYVENLVDFIDKIIEKKISGTFIAMDNEHISTTQLVAFLLEFTGRKVFLFRLPDAIIKTGIYLLPRYFDRLYGSFELDNTFTRKILSYDPVFSTREGIGRMVENYKKSIEN